MAQMKSGDANAVLWLEAPSGRAYCIEITSRRKGRFGSPAWKKSVIYDVQVERWGNAEEGMLDNEQREGIAGFNEALRVGRRLVDLLERGMKQSDRHDGERGLG